jgi:adenylate cyclase
MAMDPVERRLAAILAADVVGYSRLMGEDETGTHVRLKALRKDFIEPSIAEHRGRIVKLTGDGALVEFASVVDAVQCAVEVQRSIAEHGAGLEPEQRIEFRVGINLGDVIIDDNDIYGDGVNVAVRLEGLAPPGGVCISDVVHQMVRGRLDLAFEDLGHGDSRSESALDRCAAVREPVPRPGSGILQRRPNRGSDHRPVAALGLFVTSRHVVFQYKGRPAPPGQVAKNLGVRYVLEGSIRRGANRVRINAELIDAATGFHLWAQRYDRDFEDIFALQDEIVHTIVTALDVRLTARERAGIERRYTDNLEAYDLFLQARDGFWRRTREGAAQARTSLERAIALDPKFAAAHALLADIYRSEWWYGWRDDEHALDRALDLARKSVALDDSLPFAHMFLGWIHLWRKEHHQAIAEAKRCLALDPNNAEGHVRLGHILDQAGRPTAGLVLIETAMRLDPHYPYLYLFWLAHAFHSLQRYDDAIAAYRRTISRNPDFFYPHIHLAAAYAQLGRMEEAKAEAAEALRMDPSFSDQRVAQRLPYKDPAALARLADSMRKAGLPE